MTRTRTITPRYGSNQESKISARSGASGSPFGRRNLLDDRFQHLVARPARSWR